VEARAEEVKQKLIALDRRKRDALARQRETEAKLGQERYHLGQAEAHRSRLLTDLANGDVEVVGWAEAEIEKADAEMVSHKRFIESYTATLAKTEEELTAVRNDLHELDREVLERQRAEKFEAAKGRIAKRLADAGDVLENAR
jgi:chromosome segregation ATPase